MIYKDTNKFNIVVVVTAFIAFLLFFLFSYPFNNPALLTINNYQKYLYVRLDVNNNSVVVNELKFSVNPKFSADYHDIEIDYIISTNNQEYDYSDSFDLVGSGSFSRIITINTGDLRSNFVFAVVAITGRIR